MKSTFSFILFLQFCFMLNANAQQVQSKGLKDYYKDYFPIGVAVSANDLKNTDERALILSQFNSLTPENSMKMAPIHPKEDLYRWKDADSIVAFAQAHGLEYGAIICAGTNKRLAGFLKIRPVTWLPKKFCWRD
jgi:endo-1,4-beta-xylanase